MMPLSFRAIFRLGILLVLIVYVFLMYCLARGISEQPAVTLWPVIRAGAFSLVMMIPVLWLAGISELPDALTRHRGQRWWERQQCPHCGYTIRGAMSGVCPECAGELAPPAGFEFGWGTVRRFLMINIVAWCIGVGVGEMWIRADEMRFLNEAGQQEQRDVDAQPYHRPRIWPNQRINLEE